MTLSFSIVRLQHSMQAFISHNDLDSGHGGQTKDLDGDEADGYDEGALGVSFYQESWPIDSY